MVQNLADTIKIAGQPVERSTLAGLQKASLKSGVSFQYLVAKAAQESSLQTDAQADTSSASGLFQFTRSTWLDMMKKYGALYGYGAMADKITVNDSGKASVSDSTAEQRILALRSDPEASGLMAAEYARDNAMTLHDALGRGVDASDLYLAHFLGASGASQLLTAATETPTTSAASLLPAAAKANASVFYTADGRARSAADVVKLVRERFMGQMDRYADAAATLSPGGAASATSIPAAFTRISATASAGAAPNMGANTASAPGQSTSSPTSREAMAKSMINQMMMQELVQLISTKPMVMSDGDTGAGNDTAISSGAMQGDDLANAMSKALGKSTAAQNLLGAGQDAIARSLVKGRASDALRTYDMLNAVPTPSMPLPAPSRKDSTR